MRSLSLNLNSSDYGLKDVNLFLTEDPLFLDQQDYDESFFNSIYNYKNIYKYCDFLRNIYLRDNANNNLSNSFFSIYHVSFNIFSMNNFFLFFFLNKLKNERVNITRNIILNVFDCLYSNPKNKFYFEKNNVIHTQSLFFILKNKSNKFYYS